MQKRGELSRLDIILIILISIVLLTLVFFILFRIVNNVKEGNILVEDLDLKISQVKIVDDKTTEITVKRNEGEGEFSGLSFLVDDGSNIEIIKKETSMIQNESETFSLKFIIVNASRIKKIAITPIFEKGNGEEIIGDVEDEYITPNTCSNYCPKGAQCGLNDCGMQCGNGCSKDYLCLNYKCIKQQTSSGGSGGGSGGSSTPTCNSTCSSLGYQCGTQTICGESVNCGTCNSEYVCSLGLCILEETCTDTCNSLNYNCGTHLICGVNVNCGTCPTGFSCAVNGTCMKDVIVNCGDINCKTGEYCSNGVCLLNVTGKTYFVATNGNDAGSGNFTHPWKTWQKAFDTANAGDIVYFRGGIWYPTQASYGNNILNINPQAGVGNSGTAENPIKYFNYPGEKPILDCSLINPSGNFNTGIEVYRAHFLHFKGLTIRNVIQPRVGVEAFGMVVTDSSNHIYENMVFHDIGGNAFRFAGVPVGYHEEVTYDNNYFINCDAYNNYDPYNPTPGNAGDGFKAILDIGEYAYFYNCRAWNNSDDGFDMPGPGIAKLENCWSFDNGWWDSINEGTGYKTGAVGTNTGEDVHHKLVNNCIAANNKGNGFFDVDYDPYVRSNSLIYNNLAYKNGIGFVGISNVLGSALPRTTVYKNNIVYDSQNIGPVGVADEVDIPNIVYPESHNTWDWYDASPGSYPWWVYSNDITVTDEDFVSLDYSQLKQPRKLDESLPDITFGHLAEGSDLIDAGTIISGYHCTTSGSHPGQNCVEWYGSAPDLGPFESNY